jgi:hypothetical protein
VIDGVAWCGTILIVGAAVGSVGTIIPADIAAGPSFGGAVSVTAYTVDTWNNPDPNSAIGEYIDGALSFYDDLL